MSQKKGAKGGVPAKVAEETNPYEWENPDRSTWITRKAHNSIKVAGKA